MLLTLAGAACSVEEPSPDRAAAGAESGATADESAGSEGSRRGAAAGSTAEAGGDAGEAAVADRGAEATAVADAFQRFLESWRLEEVDAVVDAFTPSAVVIDPSPPGVFRGADEIRGLVQEAFAAGEAIHVDTWDLRIRTAGPTAWLTCRYAYTYVPVEAGGGEDSTGPSGTGDLARARDSENSAAAGERRDQAATDPAGASWGAGRQVEEGHLSMVWTLGADGAYRARLFHASRRVGDEPVPAPGDDEGQDAADPATERSRSGR